MRGSSIKPDPEAIAARATQMLELLSEENASLRADIDQYYRKVSKLQKVLLSLKQLTNAITITQWS